MLFSNNSWSLFYLIDRGVTPTSLLPLGVNWIMTECVRNIYELLLQVKLSSERRLRTSQERRFSPSRPRPCAASGLEKERSWFARSLPLPATIRFVSSSWWRHARGVRCASNRFQDWMYASSDDTSGARLRFLIQPVSWVMPLQG